MEKLTYTKVNRSRRNITAMAGVALMHSAASCEPYSAKLDATVLIANDYVALRGYTGSSLIARVLKTNIRGEFECLGTNAGLQDNGGTIIIDALGRTWVRIFNGPVFLEWFGAFGDGTTDDTNSLVNALGTGRNILCESKTYCISSEIPLIIKDQGEQIIEGSCRTILRILKRQSTDLFRFKGPVALKNLIIDFSDGPSRYPFRWEGHAGHILIDNVHVKNLIDNDSATGTVVFFITPTGNTFELNKISFKNLKKKGNGKITDASGSLNCIYIGGGPGSVQGTIDKVNAESIHNIDSDGVIIFEDTSIIYCATQHDDLMNRISIRDISGYNFGKRLLKIHSSNVTVDSVVGHSTEGDTLGVIGFMTDQGLGLKKGCSASNVRAIGNMDYAFASSAPGVKWMNVVASVQRGNVNGQSFSGTALLVNGDDTIVDGFWSDSSSDISIGASSQIVKNTVLRNLTTFLNARKSQGNTIFNSYSSAGYDGLLIDGLVASIQNDAVAMEPICLNSYLNGDDRVGRNLRITNVVIRSDSDRNKSVVMIRHVKGLSLSSVDYVNTTKLTNPIVVSVDDCSDVSIDDLVINGSNQIGVLVNNCNGSVRLSNIVDDLASIATIHIHNCPDTFVVGCDYSKVVGHSSHLYQVSKQMVGGKLSRPISGLSAGWTQYFDTSLNKPIWWNGSGWCDSTGVRV